MGQTRSLRSIPYILVSQSASHTPSFPCLLSSGFSSRYHSGWSIGSVSRSRRPLRLLPTSIPLFWRCTSDICPTQSTASGGAYRRIASGISMIITLYRSCVVIGFASQWWARSRRPVWFRKYNYLTSAALDGGSQVILFVLVSCYSKFARQELS